MKKKYILMLIYIVICVSILFANERYVKDEFFNKLLMTLAISGITTVIYSLLSIIIDKDNILSLLKNSFPLLKKGMEYGLISIDDDFPLQDEKIKNDFITSKIVYINMNDGKNLFSNHTELFKKRFFTKGNLTKIVLLDCEEKELMDILARKNGHDEKNYYINKINSVITYHIQEYKQQYEDHTIKLYLNPNYNTMAAIVTDHYAMISLYRLALGKTRVMHMTFKKGLSEYDEIRKDLEELCTYKAKEYIF